MTIFSAWHWYMDDDAKWHITPFFRSWAQHDVDDLRVESLDLDLSLGAAGSLTFVLRPSNACYDAFTKFRSYILIYRDGTDIIWAGRVINESKDLYNAYTVEAEGLLAQFNDCLIPTPSKDSDGNRELTKTISEWVEYIIRINKDTDAISGLPANGLRRISKGNIAGGSNSYTLSASSPTKAMDLLQNIQDEFAGYFLIRIVNQDTDGVYPYLDFVMDETSANSQVSTSEAQESKSIGNWDYWVYSQSGWEVSTLGNWTVTVNRPVGSDYATVTGTIQMMSPGGQSAAWSVVVTVNGTSYTYSDAAAGYGNGTYVHVAGKYYTLSKSFQIPVSDSAGSLSGAIKFQCVGVSGLYKSASWNIKYDAKAKSETSEVGRPVRAEINFGENMLTLSQESNGTDIYTVLEAYGDTPEDEDDPINLSSVNNGKLYVTSSNIKEFGAVATTKTFDGITDPSELLTEAKKEVEKLSKSKVTLSFDALDLHDIDESYDAFNIGDKIKVKSAPNNIDDYFTIKSISYKLSDSGTLHPSITMEEEKDGYVSKTFHDTKKYKNELDAIKATFASNKELQKNIADVVTSVVYDYALSSDKNNPPLNDSSYSMTIPERQMGYYIWMRTRTYKGYSATPSDVSYACITGDKGDQGDAAAPIYTCVITSSSGQTFVNGNIATTLTAKVLKGSADQGETSFTWSRFTDDTTADTAWNTSHSAKSKSIEITAEDFDRHATFYASTTHAGISLVGSIDLVDLTDTTTYIYYSDGTNITTEPTSTSIQIGIYTGIPIDGGQPATPPRGTQWAVFKGADGAQGVQGKTGAQGVSITGVTIYYVATSVSEGVTRTSNPSDSQWTLDPNSAYATITSSKPYLWTYQKITLSDGSTIYTEANITGTFGDFITATTYQYMITSTDDAPSESEDGWSDERVVPTVLKKYAWVKTTNTYFSGSVIGHVDLLTVYGGDGSKIQNIQYKYCAVDAGVPDIDTSTWYDTLNDAITNGSGNNVFCYLIFTYENGKTSHMFEPAYVYDHTNRWGTISSATVFLALSKTADVPTDRSSNGVWHVPDGWADWYGKASWLNFASSDDNANYLQPNDYLPVLMGTLSVAYESTISVDPSKFTGSYSSVYTAVDDTVYFTPQVTGTGTYYFNCTLDAGQSIKFTIVAPRSGSMATDIIFAWQPPGATSWECTTLSSAREYNYVLTTGATRFAFYTYNSDDKNKECIGIKNFRFTNNYNRSQPFIAKTINTHVQKMIRQYYLSDSSTTVTGGEWTDVAPTEIPNNKYVWSRLALLYDAGWVYTETEYMADVTYLATKIYEVNSTMTETCITKSEFNAGLGQMVKTSKYNSEMDAIEQRLSSVEQTANDVSIHFGEDGDYTKHFSFSDSGMEIKSGNSSDIKCVIDNDSFAFVDKNAVEQLTLTASGAVLHSAKIDTVLQFANKSTNSTDWRIHETPSRALAFDWIGG